MVAAAQLHLKYNANALAKGMEEMHAQDKQTVDKALNESDRKEILGVVFRIDSIDVPRNDHKIIGELQRNGKSSWEHTIESISRRCHKLRIIRKLYLRL